MGFMRAGKVSMFGSVLAAIAASGCCIGPLVAVALGAGGFAASAVFEKWRPVFLGVTFTLLGLAWYLSYRKPKAACEQGPACATVAVSKWNKVVLLFATAFVVAAAAFPSVASALLRASRSGSEACCAPPIATKAASVVLRARIPAMDCAACALNIESVLKKQAGVEQARVRFDTKEAVVQYDNTKVSPEKLITAIDQTGFKAEPVIGWRKE
jgi:mercuric ion transport protein